ncbi:MAG: hypothetical protein ACC628_01260 [Pirellulaceae bacterium]
MGVDAGCDGKVDGASEPLSSPKEVRGVTDRRRSGGVADGDESGSVAGAGAAGLLTTGPVMVAPPHVEDRFAEASSAGARRISFSRSANPRGSAGDATGASSEDSVARSLRSRPEPVGPTSTLLNALAPESETLADTPLERFAEAGKS